MLRIDEGGYASGFLCLGDGMDGQGGLTRRLGTVDLDDASAGETAHTEGRVQSDTAGGDHLHVFYLLVAQFHDGTFAEVFLYLRHGGLQGFQLAVLHIGHFFFFFSHWFFLLGVRGEK